MTMLSIIAGMALATFVTRYTMIAVLGRGDLSLLRRWLRHIPPAVLAALVVPAALAPHGRVEMGLPAWSVLVGAIVAWRTRSVSWTIVAGMAFFWLLRVVGL